MCVCVCVQVCCRLLSRPDNADSGSSISWFQTAECVAPGFGFRVRGPRPAVSSPSFLVARLLRFPSAKGPGPARARALSDKSDTLS